MSELVTPPWDLCGFDRAHTTDPYSLTEAETHDWIAREMTALTGRVYAPRQPEPSLAPDPNARDGEWPVLAFMPHAAILAEPDDVGVPRGEREGDHGEHRWFVPVYAPVAEALWREHLERLHREAPWSADG